MTSLDNRQQTLALNLSVDGASTFPSGAGGTGSSLTLGAIRTYGFGFQPSGSFDTGGQIVDIASNSALFSLLGFSYGGNGSTTFAMPDLEDNLAVSRGQDAGQPNRNTGDTFGTDSIDLTLANVPASRGGGGQGFDNSQASLTITHAINTGGTFPGGVSHGFLGQVQSFASIGDSGLPAGWVAAQGQVLSINDNQALFSVIGSTYGGDGSTTFALPDLRGRAIVGEGDRPSDPELGDMLGTPTVTLDNAKLPTALGGGGQPLDNTQPSLALTNLVASTGIFPDENNPSDPDTPFIGEIVAFAGITTPRDWFVADGSLLPINSNQALFALYGTTYGGDGSTTFALPDLRGRAIIDDSTARPLGSTGGENQTQITQANLEDAVETPSLTVTIAADTVDAFDNQTSLREAIAFANDVTANGGTGDADNDGSDNDTITFAAGLAGSTLTLTGGELDITGDTTIIGDTNGDGRADVTVSGDGASRVYDVSGTGTEANLRSLTITQGFDAGGGGAVRGASGTTINVVQSSITGSYSGTTGGGLFTYGDANIINSTISGNDSALYGGGVSAYGALTLVNATIDSNVSQYFGGGVFVDENTSSLSIFNSTITGNQAGLNGTPDLVGGGIAFLGPTGGFSLTNTVVANNTTGTSAIANDIEGTVDTASNSYIETAATITTSTATTNGGADPDLGIIGDNSGPVDTRVPAPTSPLLDAGNAALLPADTFDLDGDGNTAEAIPLDANGNTRNDGTGMEIGAAERVDRSAMVVSTLDDEQDGNFADDDLSLREALLLVDNGGTITFDAGLAGGTISLTLGEIDIGADVTIDGDTDGDEKADITLDGGGNGTERMVGILGGSTLSLKSLTLQNADATSSGGVILNRGNLFVQDSTFANNTTSQYGGAIRAILGSTTTIANSTFTGNTSQSGAIDTSDTVTIVNSTFTGNTATGDYGGGAIYVTDGTTSLYNSTITGNIATNDGGGIFHYDGTLNVTNSIVAGNFAGGMNNDIHGYNGIPAIDSSNGANIFGSAVTGSPLGDRIIDGTPGNELIDVFEAILATSINNTSFVSGFLTDNGGPTETVLIKAGGLAENAGDDADIPLETVLGLDVDSSGTIDAAAVDVDQRGTLRNFRTSDIGALERVDLVVDTLADEDDGDYSAGDLSLREALSIALAGETITFDAALTGGATPGIDDGRILLGGSQLVIARDVTIDGDVNDDDKSDIVLDGAGASRIVEVTGDGTDASLKSLTLTGGFASNGGAIYGTDAGSGLFLQSVTIDGNTSSQNGSGYYVGGGGGIFFGGFLSAVNTTFSNNAATNNGDGGAVNLQTGAYATFTNTTFSGNDAGNDGGGVYVSGATATFNNSTITQNIADSGAGGGGLFVSNGSTISTVNTIVAQNINTATYNGYDVAEFGGAPSTHISANSFFGTDIRSGNAVTNFADNGGNVIAGGSAGLGVLADNGGTVQTAAILPGSAVIGLGNAGLLPFDDFDLDGDNTTHEDLPFDANGNRRAVATLDLGAVQLESRALIVDSSGNDDDGNFTTGNLTLREALSLAMPGETITFDVGVSTVNLDFALLIEAGSDVIIDGDRTGDGIADVSISGGGTTRLLTIESGASATLRAVNLIDGNDTGTNGSSGLSGANGEIGTNGMNGGTGANGTNGEDGGAGGNGISGEDGDTAVGGIFNAGNLTLERVGLSSLSGTGGDGGLGGDAGNGARGTGGGNGGNGTNGADGGNAGSGGNGGDGGDGGYGGSGGSAAGGIVNAAGGSLTLLDTAIAGQVATSAGLTAFGTVTASGSSGGSAGNGGRGGDGGGGGNGGVQNGAGGNAGNGGDAGDGGSGGNGGDAGGAILNRGTLIGLTGIAITTTDASVSAIYGLGGNAGLSDVGGTGGDGGITAGPGDDGMDGMQGSGGASGIAGSQGISSASILNTGTSNMPTITDTLVYLNGSDLEIAEGDAGTTTFTFHVNRAGDLSEAAAVDYTLTGLSAGLDASDFSGGVLPSGTILFSANEFSKTITFDVVADDIAEADDFFQIELSGLIDPSGGAVQELGTSTANGVILTDDFPFEVFTDAALTNLVLETDDFGAALALEIPDAFIRVSNPALVGDVGTRTLSALNDDLTVIADAGFTGRFFLDGAVDFTLQGTNTAEIIGDSQRNTLRGGDGDNTLQGRGGRDILEGGGGGDTLIGGSAADTASYANATAAVRVDLQNGALNTGDAAGDSFTSIEWFAGSAFNDRFDGSAGDERLSGGDGDDVLVGRGGRDDLRGEAGDDRLFGGNNGDILVGGDGADEHVGGAGTNFASYSDADAGILADLLDSTVNTGFATGDTYTDIAGFIGSRFGDTLRGNDLVNIIEGGDRADTISGRGKQDQLFGEDGDDRLFGNAGGDELNGGIGADELSGGAGNDTAVYSDSDMGLTVDLGDAALNTGEAAGDTFASVENIRGSAFGDVLRGDIGDNRIEGGGGDDTIIGRGGRDELIGEGGNDRLFGGNNGDILIGGDGADEHVGGAGTDFASYADASTGVLADLINTAANTGFAAGDTYVDIVGFIGSNAGDILRGNDSVNIIEGGDGADTISGRGRRDSITGGDGDDRLFGNSAKDELNGGRGADELSGGGGEDTALYSTASSGVLADLMNAAANTGEAAGDTYASIENLQGSVFGDTLNGDTGNNRIEGGGGGDTINGRDGVDALFGEAGNDSLDGGAGRDFLYGGADNDTLTGGTGDDRFIFRDALSIDTITDFEVGIDRIELDDAGFTSLTPGGLSADNFFMGLNARDADDFILYQASTGRLFYDADGNGAGARVRIGTIENNAALDHDDFQVI